MEVSSEPTKFQSQHSVRVALWAARNKWPSADVNDITMSTTVKGLAKLFAVPYSMRHCLLMTDHRISCPWYHLGSCRKQWSIGLKTEVPAWDVYKVVQMVEPKTKRACYVGWWKWIITSSYKTLWGQDHEKDEVNVEETQKREVTAETTMTHWTT